MGIFDDIGDAFVSAANDVAHVAETAAVGVAHGVTTAVGSVTEVVNDGVDYVNEKYDSVIHSENAVNIANNMDEDLLVLVTPNLDWTFADLSSLVGQVTLSAVSTVLSEGAAAPTLFQSLRSLYSAFSLIKGAYDSVDQTIDYARDKIANQNINEIIKFLKGKDAITIKPGEVKSVCNRNIANPFGYMNPSQWASLSSASDKTVFITTTSCSRQVSFNTNSDYSWVVNKNKVVRATKGKLWQQDEGLGVYPFSIGSRLVVGNSLSLGECLASKDQSGFLVLQDDGNLVVYENDKPHRGKAIWDSETQNKGVTKLVATANELSLQTADGTKVWTQAVTSDCTNLFMQEDNNCVFYNSHNQPFWATKSDPHKTK